MEAENEKLRKENNNLRQEIERLKKSRLNTSEKTIAPKKVRSRSLPPYRWGRKDGHKGCPRPKPGHIDHKIIQKLKKCPECDHALGKPIDTTEHIQEDIIPARVEVTKYIHKPLLVSRVQTYCYRTVCGR